MHGNDRDLESAIVIIFTTASILISVILFFSAEKYSESDLISAALSVKEGNFNIMLFAVRPILLLLTYVSPLDPLLFLSLASLISYLISVYLSYRFARELYDKLSALLASSLLASNFAVMLLSSAPMADLPGLASALAIQYIVFKGLKRHLDNEFSWLKYGLISGLLVLVRENVMASVAAMCLLLLYKKLYKPLLTYGISTFIVIACWQIFTSEVFHMNYLTQFSTGVLLSTKYSGMIYNPSKVIGYLIKGLTPLLMILAFLGIIFDDDRERFKLIHIIGLPSFMLAILWPAIYEPRVAVIALPGMIHVCGYGLSMLIGKLSDKPIYRLCGRSGLLSLILATNICVNLFLAYINNSYSFSMIWRPLT